MMDITYFGKKRPKVVVLEVKPGVKKEYKFEPFKITKVDDDFGELLLKNAGDIFKRVDKDERKPDPKPQPKTEGYVGDVHAKDIPDLNKQIEQDKKEEEGKTVEQILEEEASKKKKKKAKKEDKK